MSGAAVRIVARVTDDAQVYRDLMRFRPDGLSPNAWAVKAGVSRTVWADMRRHGNPSRRTLEKLLLAIGSSVAEFEALRIGPDSIPAPGSAPQLAESGGPWAAASIPPLPLVASSLVGEWEAPGSGIALMQVHFGEIVDRAARPASLAGDPEAYAITTVAKSMWPRFRPGRRLAVSPRAAVAIGDDVLILLDASAAGSGLALIGELVARANSSVELTQFAPNRSFAIEDAKILKMVKIVGELI